MTAFEPGDRQPIPPEEQPAIDPLQPVPTPIRWLVQKVGHTPTGEPMVVLKLWMVTGETVVFLTGAAAQRLADQLFTQATGLVIAGGDSPIL